ncbi:hypothetical protein CU044_2881 [Streptomyces sp. L-9-10]|nr:hypothetical protein CU044_2881 [Streptomyces sp. L-9-10]
MVIGGGGGARATGAPGAADRGVGDRREGCHLGQPVREEARWAHRGPSSRWQRIFS